MEITTDQAKANVMARIGAQPIAVAAAALVIMVVGVGSVGLWRAYTGNSPEQERITSARAMQARATQASEQLVEKTKGLEVSQQESIDQLQTVQEQLQTVKRLLTAQQTETKRLSEQVGGLTGAIDTLRQSFASTQSSEPSSPPAAQKKSIRSRPHAMRPHGIKGRLAGVHRKRIKSR